jgi:hypothetical protein
MLNVWPSQAVTTEREHARRCRVVAGPAIQQDGRRA